MFRSSPAVTYEPGFGNQQVLEYPRTMRERAVWLMWKYAKDPDLPFFEPERWRTEQLDPADLDAYGFLRALEWLGVAVPVKTFKLTATRLKWVTEHRPFIGRRIPVGEAHTEYVRAGVYVCHDVCAIAVRASGLCNRVIPSRHPGNPGTIEVAASLPRDHVRPEKGDTGIFPGCLGHLDAVVPATYQTTLPRAFEEHRQWILSHAGWRYRLEHGCKVSSYSSYGRGMVKRKPTDINWLAS
jgi:hypothetical protein